MARHLCGLRFWTVRMGLRPTNLNENGSEWSIFEAAGAQPRTGRSVAPPSKSGHCPPQGIWRAPPGTRLWHCSLLTLHYSLFPVGCSQGSSCEEGGNDFAGNVREPEIAALEFIGQLGVVHSHAIEDGGVHVVDVHGIFHHVVTELIGPA